MANHHKHDRAGGGRKKITAWIDTDARCMMMSALFLLWAAHLTYCLSYWICHRVRNADIHSWMILHVCNEMSLHCLGHGESQWKRAERHVSVSGLWFEGVTFQIIGETVLFQRENTTFQLSSLNVGATLVKIVLASRLPLMAWLLSKVKEKPNLT